MDKLFFDPKMEMEDYKRKEIEDYKPTMKAIGLALWVGLIAVLVFLLAFVLIAAMVVEHASQFIK